MTLYEKYGLVTPLQRYLDDLEASRESGGSVFSAEIVASSVPLARHRIAVCAYLKEDLVCARKHGAYVGKETVDYFYGSWRSKVKTDSGTIDPNWWHGRINWMTHFSVAMCWASTVGDWKTVNRVAEYPSEECMVDPGLAKEDKSAYSALAQYLRGEPKRCVRASFTMIEKGKKQKPKFLAGVIDALYANDQKRFQESLEAYLDYFRKSEFKLASLDKLLCLDGTSLLNLGQRKGMSFGARAEFKDYLIRV